MHAGIRAWHADRSTMKIPTFLLAMIFGWALAAVAASGPWLTDWPPGDPGTAHQAEGKAVTVGSGGALTLWDSGSGATGEIDFISIVVAAPSGAETVQICQDADFAESTPCSSPSVNVVLEDWTASRGSASFRTRYVVYNNSSSGVNYSSYIRAPFTSHTRVSIALAAGKQVWWDIGYHLNSGLNWGRYSHLHAIDQSATYPVNNTTPLFSVANGPGVIWGVYAFFLNVLGQSLESKPQWNIDGNVNIDSSGTEDYFGSSFDWSSGLFTTDFVGCTFITGTYTGGYTAGAYRLNILDPIEFNSTAQFLFGNSTTINGVAYSPAPATIFSLVWYYTSN